MQYQYSDRSFSFDKLPFYWQPLTEETKNRFPETLPFELVMDEESGVLSQVVNPEVLQVIRESYKAGTYIEGLMNEAGIGAEYSKDFLSFIDDGIGLASIRGKDVLEVGCGSGYFLDQLSKMGANVLGYEPGYAAIGKYDLPVIRDFFPSPEIATRKFDVIVCFGLLEHIDHPVVILNHFREYLAPQGCLILAVPDCEQHLRSGDISMLVHEHFSYFTLSTFQRFVEKHGFVSSGLKHSNFGGSLYGIFLKGAVSQHKDLTPGNVFLSIIESIRKLEDFFRRYAGKTVGVYVPMRSMNALYLLKDIISSLQIRLRLFDDSLYLRGKYCPGIDMPIEDPATLNNPKCDVILIYSYSFGAVIKEKIRNKFSGNINMVLIGEL